MDLKPRHENTSLLYHALRLSVQQGDCVDRLYIRHKRSYLELSVSSSGAQTMRHHFALAVYNANVTKIGASHATTNRRRNFYFIERFLASA